MSENGEVKLHRGLRDVFVDRTLTSLIDGKGGRLFYRGYDIDELIQFSTFEETAYLLLRGSMPSTDELAAFDAELRSLREMSGPVVEVLRQIQNAHPMDVLRTAVSSLGTQGSRPKDTSVESALCDGMRLIAVVPTIVAAHDRMRKGVEPVPPDGELSHAANLLFMLSGERPDREDAVLLDRDLLLHIEHGVSASAFAARVVASTRADIYSAITAAIGALKGPIHGGAAEAVMRMVREIGDESNVKSYIEGLRAEGGRVMGFGHPVYKTEDPRAVHLREGALALGKRKGQHSAVTILQEISRTMEPYAKRGICQNVDFWSGAIYDMLGIDEDLFVPIFAVGRLPGWVAHCIEQYETDVLMRPRLDYQGPVGLPYVPISQRT